MIISFKVLKPVNIMILIPMTLIVTLQEFL